MGLARFILQLFRAVKFLMRAVAVLAVTVVGWLIIQDMVSAGQLPSRPLGLATMGLPATLFGIPTVYAVGILLVDGLVLFGEGGSSSNTYDDVDGDGIGDFGDGGGFGDGGAGDGGGGGGGGGE